MKVKVLAFATAKDALREDELSLELPTGSTIADLSRSLQQQHPALASIWPRLAVALDGELCQPEAELRDGCEVALLPPVSGGVAEKRTSLVDEPIDVAGISDAAAHASCGALVLFIGHVRDHHGPRSVAGITYDAYRDMAERQLEAIAVDFEETGERLRVRIAHRLGDIPVGEASVVIAVASPHRAAAFETSRAVLERLKREVPIWKRERYTDGGVAWREEEPLA